MKNQHGEKKMRIAIAAIVAVGVLGCGALCLAWNPQPQPQPTYGLPSSYGSQAPVPQSAVPQQSYPAPPPPMPHYQQPAPLGYADTAPDNYPQYPSPQYHNPFFDGMSPRNVLSNTLEWFFSLPANVMERMSNFVDNNVFPQAPATYGGQRQMDAQPQYHQQAPAAPPAGPPPWTPGAQGQPGGIPGR